MEGVKDKVSERDVGQRIICTGVSSGIERQLEPMDVLVPACLILTVENTDGNLKVFVDSFGVGWIGVIGRGTQVGDFKFQIHLSDSC